MSHPDRYEALIQENEDLIDENRKLLMEKAELREEIKHLEEMLTIIHKISAPQFDGKSKPK